MAIIFHCEHCNRRIEAPDNTGGKWAKCPSCHNKVYIPNLTAEDDDELKLAPIDENDEEKQKRLMAEAFQLSQSILQEREDTKTNTNTAGAENISQAQLKENIILYIRQMANGELQKADRIANSIVSAGSRALEVLDEIALSEIPDSQLADLPQQVLSSLIRKLRAKIQ